MSKNEVALFEGAGLPAVVNVDKMTRTAAAAAQGSERKPYLRLLKSGEWVYSGEDVEVQEGSKWAIHPYSFASGYCAWAEGALVGEAMASASDDPVAFGSLPAVGAEWKKQVAFHVACVSGDDAGKVQAIFKSSAKGAMRPWSDLLLAVGERIKTGSAFIVPVVKMETGDYKHAEYGRIYYPKWPIVEWMDLEGNIEGAKVTKRVAAAPAAAPEAAAPAAAPQVASAPRRRRPAVA